ncbi:hypothetical protein ACFWM5_06960 [Streptomyces bobili]|uniref:hypothetical protein n=1 Tax=Streptomyces bobili TaxID=67280 RepID=UPI003649FBCE
MAAWPSRCLKPGGGRTDRCLGGLELRLCGGAFGGLALLRLGQPGLPDEAQVRLGLSCPALPVGRALVEAA